jgi:hypothetical protein
VRLVDEVLALGPEEEFVTSVPAPLREGVSFPTVKVIKVSVNVSAFNVEALKTLAVKRGTTMTEVLRQAIGTEKFIDDVNEDGGRIFIEDKKRRLRQLVFR